MALLDRSAMIVYAAQALAMGEDGKAAMWLAAAERCQEEPVVRSGGCASVGGCGRGLITAADGYPPSVLGTGGTMRGVSLPSAHEGERVVEPHLVDGDAVDLRSGQLFRRVGTVHAVRLDAPFHVMENGHRKVGNAGDWLLEDEFGQRHVVDPESFEMLFEEA